jgi:DNA repair exonuclease SbcCD ATPase subunit
MNKILSIGQLHDLFQKYGDLGVNVNTPYGYKHISDCQITEKNGEIYRIETENGLFLECSENHRVKLKNGDFVSTKFLNNEDLIQTILGDTPISKIFKLNKKEDLLDIQVDEVEQYYSNGIVSHNSTMTIDLLLFLFFNTTTKSKTNAEIFNIYSDVNDVVVKGYISIDGLDYMIQRTITRKKSKTGEYTVKSDLDFYKIHQDGVIENLSEDQRRSTEAVLKNAIGTEEDFLYTILTTGKNLEQLIDSKPTARGQILTKFLGLESLKEKEDMCKKLYTNWSKNIISNTYNITDLKLDNEKCIKVIDENKDDIKRLEELMARDKTELLSLETRRDVLYNLRNNDIDPVLLKANPDALSIDIEKLNKSKLLAEIKLNSIVVKEPYEYYLESAHQEVKDEISNLTLNNKLLQNEIEIFNKEIKNFEDGKCCYACKRPFKNADHTTEINEIKQKITDIIKKISNNEDKISLFSVKNSKYIALKSEYDEYEKNKLIKTRYELEIAQTQNEINSKNNILEKYNNNKIKMENNEKIDTELITVKSRILTINGNINQTTIDIEKDKNNIIKCNETIANNDKLIIKIKEEEKFIKGFETYLQIYGKNGISKVIMKNMIPLLNQELNRILNDSCYFTLELIINEKNELEFLMIDNETRLVKSLYTGSGYERTVSALALRAVLTKVSTLPKPNIVIMDEVFGKVADENLEMIGEFFKKIKQYFEHIFVISHNPLVRNWSDNVIMIKKDENISSIDYISIKI